MMAESGIFAGAVIVTVLVGIADLVAFLGLRNVPETKHLGQ